MPASNLIKNNIDEGEREIKKSLSKRKAYGPASTGRSLKRSRDRNVTTLAGTVVISRQIEPVQDSAQPNRRESGNEYATASSV